MRYLLSILVFTLLSFGASAQNLEVIGSTDLQGVIGKELEARFSIRNTSDQTVNFIIQRSNLTIGSSQSSFFCLDNNCFDKSTDISDEIITLKPGEVYDGFRSVLKTGLSEGYSTIKYSLIEKGSEENVVDIEINHNIVDKISNNLLYSSKDVTINEVYPNPVTDHATIDYSIMDKETEVKIVLHSVLGSVLGEYNLQPLESSLKMTFDAWNPGVYFYTLYIDNDGVMTKKLVIKK